MEESTMFKIYTGSDNTRLLNIQIISKDYPDIIDITDVICVALENDVMNIYSRIYLEGKSEFTTCATYYEIINISKKQINIYINSDNSIEIIVKTNINEKISLSEELSNEIINKTIILAELCINNKELLYSNETIEF